MPFVSSIFILLVCLFCCFTAVRILDNDVRESYRLWKESLRELPKEKRERVFKKEKKLHPTKLSSSLYFGLAIAPAVICALVALISSLSLVGAIMGIILSLVGLGFMFWVMSQAKNGDEVKATLYFALCPALTLAVSIANLGGSSANGFGAFIGALVFGIGIVLFIYVFGAHRVKQILENDDDDEDEDDDEEEIPRPRPSTRVPRRVKRRSRVYDEDDMFEDDDFYDEDPDD